MSNFHSGILHGLVTICSKVTDGRKMVKVQPYVTVHIYCFGSLTVVAMHCSLNKGNKRISEFRLLEEFCKNKIVL